MNRVFTSKQLVWLGLFLAIVFDTIIQLAWKQAVSSVPEDASLLQIVLGTISQPCFLIVAGTFVLQLFNWLKVLDRADLSYAQPITALSYISVVVLSAWLLHEQVHLRQIIGICLILVGVKFISETKHKTVSVQESLS